MRETIEYIRSYDNKNIFFCLFIIVGFVTSNTIMSIGTIAMFVNVILGMNYKQTIREYWDNKSLVVMSSLFVVSLFSLTYSTDVSNGLEYVINKLPLFVIPLAMSRQQKFPKMYFDGIILFFVLTIFVSSLVVLFYYFQDFELTTKNLKRGMAVWVPHNHIRYGVMMVFALISTIYLYFTKDFLEDKKFKLLRYFYLFLAVFFFVMIHLLAVRTAILGLYLSIIISLLYYFLRTKNLKIMFLGFFLMVSIPIFSYHFIEGFRNKVEYMKYDWQQYNNNSIGNNSDARRMRSYKVGMEVLKDTFPLGAGAGDTKKVLHDYYKKNYPNVARRNWLDPHNQILYTSIELGLFGFLALCFTLFYPLFLLNRNKKHIYYILFWIIACTPLIYDISLEMQLGITFFALFSSLFIKNITNQETNE